MQRRPVRGRRATRVDGELGGRGGPRRRRRRALRAGGGGLALTQRARPRTTKHLVPHQVVSSWRHM